MLRNESRNRPKALQMPPESHVATSAQVPVYRVHRASSAIRIDGVLDEWDWILAEQLRYHKICHEPEDSKPLREKTFVASLWDDQNLYLAFVVQDREIWATVSERDARLFPEECVEFFLDPDGNGERYIEAQVNSINNMRDLLVDGSVKDPTYPEFDQMALWDFQNLEKAVHLYRGSLGQDIGWTLEIAMPWSELSFSRRKWPPKPGDELRINFYRYERSQRGELPLEQSGWSTVNNFHTPGRFGRFVFVSSPPGRRVK